MISWLSLSVSLYLNAFSDDCYFSCKTVIRFDLQPFSSNPKLTDYHHHKNCHWLSGNNISDRSGQSEFRNSHKLIWQSKWGFGKAVHTERSQFGWISDLKFLLYVCLCFSCTIKSKRVQRVNSWNTTWTIVHFYFRGELANVSALVLTLQEEKSFLP